MPGKLVRSLGIVAALLVPSSAVFLGASSPAGATINTVTFASGSTLNIRIGIITLTLQLATGTDGTNPRGSVAVTVTGSHFTTSKTFGVPGNAGDTLMELPAGTVTGTLTGTSVVSVDITTASGSAPEVKFETYTTGLQDCVILDTYSEDYTGSNGSLTATTSASTFRTHAHAGNATGPTCPSSLATYLDTYGAKAKISGTASVS